jgi:hypothetical protein
MQAPKVAPPDLICRDKFLVQSTAVPEGTKEEDVTSNTVGWSFFTLLLLIISFI